MKRRSKPLAADLAKVRRDARPYLLENAARFVAGGETPLRFWLMQRALPWQTVAKRSGVDMERLYELARNGSPAAAEAVALAPVLQIEPADLYIGSDGLLDGRAEQADDDAERGFQDRPIFI